MLSENMQELAKILSEEGLDPKVAGDGLRELRGNCTLGYLPAVESFDDFEGTGAVVASLTSVH